MESVHLEDNLLDLLVRAVGLRSDKEYATITDCLFPLLKESNNILKTLVGFPSVQQRFASSCSSLLACVPG